LAKGKREAFVSVDIEADGPIPGEHSMSAIGAVLVDEPQHTFYRELRPISEKWDPRAAAVAGLDRDKLIAEGTEAAVAMQDFASWLDEVCGTRRPVLVAFNASFDWMWVHWYFVKFLGRDPFGISGLDIKAYAMGALGREKWSETTKKELMRDRRLRTDLPHTHHALDDAREQAELFAKVRAITRPRE
jgi:DNA polymerase III epsilon subunit-like protein